MSQVENILVIMAKEPVAGRVKSRLASGVGFGRATGFFRNTLAAQIRRVGQDPRWHTVLSVNPDLAVHARCWPCGLQLQPQGRGDIGQRMQHIFNHQPHANVVIVGADIPDIRRRHITQAFALLKSHDAVFGPADDGGYWLVGRCARTRQQFFENVRWSGPHALSDTMRNLDSLKTGFLESLNDIDDADDFRLWNRTRHFSC